MYTLFSPDHAEALIARIEQLTPDHQAHWGKMNAGQMIAHCNATMAVVRDQQQIKRVFIGYLLGGLMKSQFYNDKPYGKNGPTHPTFVFTDERELEKEKSVLINHIRAFQQGGPEKCTRQPHAFFGKLTPEQWAMGMYKHTDHHLRQFGV